MECTKILGVAARPRRGQGQQAPSKHLTASVPPMPASVGTMPGRPGVLLGVVSPVKAASAPTTAAAGQKKGPGSRAGSQSGSRSTQQKETTFCSQLSLNFSYPPNATACWVAAVTAPASRAAATAIARRRAAAAGTKAAALARNAGAGLRLAQVALCIGSQGTRERGGVGMGAMGCRWGLPFNPCTLQRKPHIKYTT